MPRVYVRRFDHDEAARRHRNGETLAELARAYGVCRNAVEQAIRHLDPVERAKDREAKKAWYTATCEDCGGPAMREIGGHKRPDGRCLCVHCRGVASRESLRFNGEGVLLAVRCQALDCANGERWQSPGEFSRGERFHDVREGGIHGQCRLCLRRAKAHERDRKRVPCRSCGAPCLPAGMKGKRGRDTGLCFRCYQANRRAAA